MNTSLQKLQNLAAANTGLLLFLCFVLLSLFNFSDYGLTWDSPEQHKAGIINYEYVFEGNKEFYNYTNKDYGCAIELPLILLEKGLGLQATNQIYPMRHFVTHLLFLFAGLCLFWLIDFLYQNKYLASIGFLMLVLHPRLYAHSFFNSKDIPFLSLFIICFYLAALAFKHYKLWRFVLLGMATGLLISTRIIGIIFPMCILTFFILDVIFKEKKRKTGIALLLFIITSMGFTALCWPYLWNQPFEHFWISYMNMKKFRWEANVLFMGDFILSTELPWYYLPVWISITTPILYLIMVFTGTLALITNFLKKPFSFIKEREQRNQLLYLGVFLLPTLGIILLNTTIYDSWRHLFFIYSGFIMLAIYGLNFIMKKLPKKIPMLLFFVSFSWVGIFMIQKHPHQHTYFNEFLSFTKEEFIRKNYELEYWGTSYYDALQYISQHDDRDSINIAVANLPGEFNMLLLTEKDQKRIHLSTREHADYFISNYRNHPKDYKEYKGKKVAAFKVYGNTFQAVFKLK